MTVRIGLLGVAHLHVDAYVANLRAAGATVVGTTDEDPVRGRQWAATHDVPWYGTPAGFYDTLATIESAMPGVLDRVRALRS